MASERRVSSACVVPLGSPDAGKAPAPDTPGARVALVLELSAIAWRLTGKPFPTYARHAMPTRVVPRRAP